MRVSSYSIIPFVPSHWLVIFILFLILSLGGSSYHLLERTITIQPSVVERTPSSVYKKANQVVGLTIFSLVSPPNRIDALPRLSSLTSDNLAETENAINSIIIYAERSRENRTLVINTLRQIIELPDIEQKVITSTEFHRLWSNILKIFRTLKATETLDLFINCLPCGDETFSSSMSNLPAYNELINFGELAVPTLTHTLAFHENPKVRSLSAMCLGRILGKDARPILERALENEKISTVKDAIQFELRTLDREPNG